MGNFVAYYLTEVTSNDVFNPNTKTLILAMIVPILTTDGKGSCSEKT